MASIDDKKVAQKWEVLGALYKYGCKPDVIKRHLSHIDKSVVTSIIKSFSSRSIKVSLNCLNINQVIKNCNIFILF